jgi:hypothetical protein
MGERRCRYCEKTFQLSKYQRRQTVCSDTDCQKRRRTDYRQQKLKTDEEYRQVCRDSSRKWRSRNPEYWKRYREKRPDAVAQNREKQQGRDGKQRLLDLANNNSVSGKVFVIQALPCRKGPGRESCKQQPASSFSAFAG